MSWRTVALGSLCDVKTGKKDVNEGNENGIYPFFTCAAKHTYSDVFSFDCEAILIAGNGAVGQTSYYSGKFEAYQRTYVLCNFVDVIPQYLLYVLNGSLMKELSSKVLGNTIPYIKKGMLTEFQVPLPPISTQQKIVAKLDAIFAEIDKATAAAEANVRNAEALFQSYLTQIFERGGEVCSIRKLKELTFKITDGSHNPPKGVEYSDFIMFSSKNISNDRITFESPRYLTKEDYELEDKRTRVSLGDVLLTIVGTIGRCAVVEDANLKITLQRSVAVIKPKPEINSRFLMYFFLSINNFLNNRARGVAQKGVYLETLRDLEIRFPSLLEQESIVIKLDDISSKTQGMAVCYLNKIEQLTCYKSSILRQAFAGEFVKE